MQTKILVAISSWVLLAIILWYNYNKLKGAMDVSDEYTPREKVSTPYNFKTR